MEDYPARFADLLESVAVKARALTVDRADKGIRIAALAIPAATLGLLAVIFLFMTIHGALAIPLGDVGAFAVVAGLFAIGGALLWSNRDKQPKDNQ